MSSQRHLDDVPDIPLMKIFGHLPMKQRVRNRRVSKRWTRSTLLGVSKIVFVRINFEEDYSPLLGYFRFAQHNRISVRNNVEIESLLRQCREQNARLESVKFMSINFTPSNHRETEALQIIGQQLVGLNAIELCRCTVNDDQHLHALVAYLTNLVSLELDFFGTSAILAPVVQNVVKRNPQIKHFKLRDPGGDYVQLELTQSLVTFHIAVEPRNLHRFLWVSLRQNSGQTLRVFKSEYFDGEQEQYLDFPNLEAIRIGHVRNYPSQMIIPSRKTFPKVKVLTTRFLVQQGHMQDLIWLFQQHNNLEILDVGVFFNNENSLNVIANSCPLLRYLSLGVNFVFTNNGVAQVLRLTHLRYLQLCGNQGRITDQQLVQVVELQHLRALRCNCGAVEMPLTEAAFREKAVIDNTRPYFLKFTNNELEELGNVLLPTTMCRSFFYSWGDNGPFGITDYNDWERLNMRMLRQTFGTLHQQH